MVLDEKSSDIDRLISERVSRNHRYDGGNMYAKYFKQNQDFGIIEEQMVDNDSDKGPYESYNPLTHDSKGDNILNRDFLKKYLHRAKRVDANLTLETSEYISRKWTELRNKDFEYTKNKGNSRVLPVTVRTLESMIRLATAHAKLRISRTVDIQDCDAAIALVRKTLFDEDEETSNGSSQHEVQESKALPARPTNNKMDIETQPADNPVRASVRISAAPDVSEEVIQTAAMKDEAFERLRTVEAVRPAAMLEEDLPVVPSVKVAPQAETSIQPEEGETRTTAAQADVVAIFKELAQMTSQKHTSTLDLDFVYEQLLPKFKTRQYIDLCLAQIELKGKYMVDRTNSKIHAL